MTRDPADRTCPLCQVARGTEFFEDSRDYFRCPNCRLVFVLPRQFLSPQEEKRQYDLHENSPDDRRYRQFLSRLFEPLSARLALHSQGLDFGSGPGPTLSVMFEEAGHAVDLYDPLYAPNKAVFGRQYDFVTATEVLEHLHEPRQELDRLWACLKPGGWLGVMTKLVLDSDAFSRWHYKNDPTHVCFYSSATFGWLAEHFGATFALVGNDVALFEKARG